MQDGESPIRVAVVDEHQMVRTGMANLLAVEPDMALVGSADCLRSATALIDRQTVDVMLLDLHLPEGSGMDLCKIITRRRLPIRVVILTSLGDEMQLFSALEAGAAGYLLKTARGRTVIEAIRAVAQSGDLLEARKARWALDVVGGGLTGSERRILTYIAERRTHSEMGELLMVGETDLKNRISRLFAKLRSLTQGVRSS